MASLIENLFWNQVSSAQMLVYLKRVYGYKRANCSIGSCLKSNGYPDIRLGDCIADSTIYKNLLEELWSGKTREETEGGT
jgi:hypothetical protein